VSAEVRKRSVVFRLRIRVFGGILNRWVNSTVYSFLMNDLNYSTFFITAPHFSAGSINFSLPCSEEAFSASTAAEWAQVMRNEPEPSAPYYDVASSIFVDAASVFSFPGLTPFVGFFWGGGQKFETRDDDD
jgi:hypothetical protein